MKIYIPTLGRPDEQPAYEQLNRAGLEPWLVVDKSDCSDYSRYRSLEASVRGIAEKRQWIVEHAGRQKFCMIDDDMTIGIVYRSGDVCTIDRHPTPGKVRGQFEAANKLLNTFAHGGVHTRHFVNYAKQPYETNRGYYRQIMFFNPALVPRMPAYVGYTAEDVRFKIALLEQGLDYFIMTSCCMLETKAKSLPTHFTQDSKNKDMRALGAEYPDHVRKTKDGRITLSYSGILKAAKKKLQAAE